MRNKQVLNLTAFKVLTIPWNYTYPIRIHGHGVNTSNDQIGLFNLPWSTRSPGSQRPSSIKDGELWLNDRRQVCYGLIDIVLGVKTLPIPDHAHEPFHAQANTCCGVRFSNGNV